MPWTELTNIKLVDLYAFPVDGFISRKVYWRTLKYHDKDAGGGLEYDYAQHSHRHPSKHRARRNSEVEC